MEREKIIKVLNAEPLNYSEKAVSLWKNNGFEYIASSWDEIERIKKFDDISILIIRLNRYVDHKVLNKFIGLKYLVSATTGHDHIDLNYLEKKSIQLISLRGHDKFLNTIPSTAEHTWALLMALIRNIPNANEHVKSGSWNRDLFKGYQLKNKILGIIGLGRTGLKVAKYADTFEMKVKYYDPFLNNSDYLKCEKIKDLLETSDIISIHIHLNKENYKFLDKRLIKFIKKGAIIINTSRGNVWDEKALRNALRNRQISGIASDVLSTELTNIRESPLWQAQQKGENIIITPHIGGATFDAMWACEEYIINQII